MKRGQVLGILAFLLVCAIAVIPAMAANVTTSYPQAPDPATNYYNSAEEALQSGNYNEAITLYDMALSSNTTEIQESDALLYTYHDKSYAQIKLGNCSGAIDTLNAGLALYPTDGDLLNNLGYAQYCLGDYADAVASYDKSLATNENSTGTLINKGDALVKLGKYQDAVIAYKTALANNPSNNETATKLAAAEKSASNESPVTLIVLGVVVIIAGVGVAYYILKKRPADNKSDDKQPAGGSKKSKKK